MADLILQGMSPAAATAGTLIPHLYVNSNVERRPKGSVHPSSITFYIYFAGSSLLYFCVTIRLLRSHRPEYTINGFNCEFVYLPVTPFTSARDDDMVMTTASQSI